jgi:hypothetical protein
MLLSSPPTTHYPSLVIILAHSLPQTHLSANFAPLESIAYALFCTLLLKYFSELFWNQFIPHSLPKNRGCGVPANLTKPNRANSWDASREHSTETGIPV